MKQIGWLALLFSVCAPAEAQFPYALLRQVVTSGSPPSFSIPGPMAYFPARGVCLYYEGNQGFWTWNGSQWSVEPTLLPRPSTVDGMAYDSDRQVVLLYEGNHDEPSTAAPSKLWSWNGNSFELLSASGPQNNSSIGITYDSHRHRLVVYGGTRNAGPWPADTYEWDGQQWQTINTSANGPGWRQFHAMAFDARRRVTLLFGGAGPAGNYLQDTWTWDGSAWQLLPSTGLPLARQHTQMVYDSHLGHIVLFGGAYDNARFAQGDGCTTIGTICPWWTFNDIWVWDGSWKCVGGAAYSARYHAMAYDERRRQVVVFGGTTSEEAQLPTQPCRMCFYRRSDQTWLLDLLQTWVDFNYVGPESGSFTTPFNDLASAINAAVPRSGIDLKPGSGAAGPITISKPLTLGAPLGPAMIR